LSAVRDSCISSFRRVFSWRFLGRELSSVLPVSFARSVFIDNDFRGESSERSLIAWRAFVQPSADTITTELLVITADQITDGVFAEENFARTGTPHVVSGFRERSTGNVTDRTLRFRAKERRSFVHSLVGCRFRSMSSARSPKTAWLSSKLKQFALDEEIYLNYIESVLDGEEDQCEKISALEEILGEVLVSILTTAAGF